MELSRHTGLSNRGGDIASGSFEDCAERVDTSAEAAGHSVGKVNEEQRGIDLVHGRQEVFGTVDLAGSEEVEHLPAEFAGGFGKSIEKRLVADAKRHWAWHG